MYCPHCGTQVPDGQRQCPNCGRPVAPPPLPIGAPAAPAKSGSSKMVWVIVGCAVIPVVIAVVGIIAAIFIPNFLDALQKAKQKRAMSELRVLGEAVEAYKAQSGYAPEADDIASLAAKLGADGAPLPSADPWKHPYRYGCWREDPAAECDHYAIVSGGSDGIFEHDDLSAYEPGEIEPRDYPRDLVFSDGSLTVAPGRR